MLDKPTQADIDIAREVLEYVVADMETNEPHAINTIEEFNNVLRNIPNEGELGDIE